MCAYRIYVVHVGHIQNLHIPRPRCAHIIIQMAGILREKGKAALGQKGNERVVVTMNIWIYGFERAFPFGRRKNE